MTRFRFAFTCPDCNAPIDVCIVPHESIVATHPEPLCRPAEEWVGWFAQGARLITRRGSPAPGSADDVDLGSPDTKEPTA